MTFLEFAASRVWCSDIGQYLRDESLMGMQGYIYAGMMFVARTADGFEYWTIAERSEVTGNLGECEEWLWENFARDELNAQGV